MVLDMCGIDKSGMVSVTFHSKKSRARSGMNLTCLFSTIASIKDRSGDPKTHKSMPP